MTTKKGGLGSMMRAQLAAETQATKSAPTKIVIAEEEPLHRTTITMPQSDRDLLQSLVSRAQAKGLHQVSISSLVRAGIHALDMAEREQPMSFEEAVKRAPKLRAGRKKSQNY